MLRKQIGDFLMHQPANRLHVQLLVYTVYTQCTHTLYAFNGKK
jgi:hypothetical protein